ncbi:vesicle-associated protein 1-3 [Mercurialis annua]|uniref:vesicle-associated protein 1-3 n=1 Tax=Mercurialis annua TaxID=3986 RepID=UPI002160771B|nr:vesicle-associated protein 1-3 [Mercurialis annua]
MSTGDLLNVQPSELKFPFELRKQSACSIQLINKSDKYVAFKVKTTNPKKYCVRPNTCIILPGAACNVIVTMQAQKEAPPDMQCKDKFLLQSVAVPDGATTKDITADMFNKEVGNVVEDFKLRVTYIPANPPSPVPEEPEEGLSPIASVLENGDQHSLLLEAVSRSLQEPKEKSAEVWSTISRLTEEKALALQQHKQLCEELELMKRHVNKKRTGTFSLFLVLLVGLLIGYILKST